MSFWHLLDVGNQGDDDEADDGYSQQLPLRRGRIVGTLAGTGRPPGHFHSAFPVTTWPYLNTSPKQKCKT